MTVSQAGAREPDSLRLGGGKSAENAKAAVPGIETQNWSLSSLSACRLHVNDVQNPARQVFLHESENIGVVFPRAVGLSCVHVGFFTRTCRHLHRACAKERGSCAQRHRETHCNAPYSIPPLLLDYPKTLFTKRALTWSGSLQQRAGLRACLDLFPRDMLLKRSNIFVTSLKPAENSIMLQWAWFTSSLVFCNGSRLEPARYSCCSWSFGSVRARVPKSLLAGQRTSAVGTTIHGDVFVSEFDSTGAGFLILVPLESMRVLPSRLKASSALGFDACSGFRELILAEHCKADQISFESGFATGGGLKGASYTWTELYQAVLFELDPNRNQQAIQKAEIALRLRAEQLRQETNADPHERDAVSQALSVLGFLKTKQGQR